MKDELLSVKYIKILNKFFSENSNVNNLFLQFEFCNVDLIKALGSSYAKKNYLYLVNPI